MSEASGTWKEKLERLKIKGMRVLHETLFDDRSPGEKLGKSGKLPLDEDVESFSQTYSIASLLPYEAFDPQKKIYLNSDSLGFMLIGNPAVGLSAANLTQLNSIFTLKYPADSVIQVTLLDDARIEPILDQYYDLGSKGSSKLNKGFFQYLANERVKFYQSGKWKSLNRNESIIVRDYKIVISVTIPIKDIEKNDELSKPLEDELCRIRGSVQGMLRTCGIHSVDLEPTPFIQIMKEILNPSTKRQDDVEWDHYIPLKAQMVDSETCLHLEAGASMITNKGERFTIIPFQEKRLPKNWRGDRNGELLGSFTKELQRMPCRFIASLTVVVPNQDSSMTKIGYNAARSKQMASSQIGRWTPVYANRQKDWEYVQARVEQGDKMLQAVYRIMIITPEGTERDAESQVKSIHAANGWQIQRSRFLPAQSILGCLPMGVTQRDLKHLKGLFVYKTRLASTCVNIAPWIGEWKGTRTPVMMHLGRKGQLISFNPFDGQRNYNVCVAAASGSGKSFWTCEWVLRVLATGGQAFVIDAGKSYQNLCNVLGGTYIDFANKNIKMNPFSSLLDEKSLMDLASRQTEEAAEQYVSNYLNSWIPMLASILGQMASPDEELSKEEESLLGRAVGLVIRSKFNLCSVDDVMKTLEDLGKQGGAQTLEATERLTIKLFPYSSEGVHGEYFNGQANMDLTNDLVVLELDALLAMGNIATVILFIIITQINKSVILNPNKSRIKSCTIDEGWRLLAKGRVSEFIEEAFRVFRKHNGSFQVIVQAIADFGMSKAARAAWDNSDWKIILSQDEGTVDRAVKEGLLREGDNIIGLIETLKTKPGEYSELIISNGQQGDAVARFVTDKFAGKLYSTKAEEAQEVRNGVAKGLKIEDVIRGLIERDRERNPA